MAKGKIDKATAVKSILSDLKKGIGKESILRRVATSCDKNRATIYRWYSEAEKQFNIFKAKAEPIIEAKEIEALGELAKAGILSKIERQRLLSSFAKGEVRVKKEVITAEGIQEIESEPTVMERKAAIAELNKMDGEYAAIKTDITTQGEAINIISLGSGIKPK